MKYTLLSLFNKTCHVSGVRALWCSGKRVRLYVEKYQVRYRFFSGYDFLFSLFLLLIFDNLFFFATTSVVYKRESQTLQVYVIFIFFPLWLYDIYLIKLYISYYLYLIKLAISLASKLCGVVVGEWDYMLKVPGSIFLFSLWFFVFFVFILFFCSFNRLEKGKPNLTSICNF